jgi:hypothetical protein
MAQKHLTYYELDLGLNHVVRKWSDPVDNGANLLIAVPGGADGPGGVLVCAENFIIYKNQDHEEVSSHEALRQQSGSYERGDPHGLEVIHACQRALPVGAGCDSPPQRPAR